MFIANSVWLDEKYVNLLSFRLDRFKRVGKHKYNFRCPLCGDSQKSKSKARGYVFEHKGKLQYKCHNCGKSPTFKNFLNEVDHSLYEQYSLEWLAEFGNSSKPIPIQKFDHQIEKFDKRRMDKFEPLKLLKKVSQLPVGHVCREYVESRRLPRDTHYFLYWCPMFYHWINKYIPGKFSEATLSKDEGRLVLPFIDQNGYVVGCTGRSLGKDSKLRYVTIKFKEDAPKIFGLDRVDFKKEVLVVEGPIDSLFLPNCIALAGSSADLSGLPLQDDTIFIFDNEPRNKDIVKQIQAYIDSNRRVCIFENVLHKDINEMIMAGMSRADILRLIHRSTHRGLQAKLALQRWKKI
jgi:transcription elongation factor Elf1